MKPLRDELSELLGFKILPGQVEQRLTDLDARGVLIGKQTKLFIKIIEHLVDLEDNGQKTNS